MPFVSGFLRVRRRRPGGGGPVDPDYGIEGPDGPEVSPPIDEDDPEVGGGPILPPPTMWPKPPPGIWPPPDRPVQPLPPGFPMPPGSIWPPVHPPHPPAGGIGGRPPERPQPGLPPTVGGGPAEPPPGVGGGPVGTKFLVAIVTVGRGGGKVIGYTVVDTSLSPGLPLPPTGGEPEPSRR